VNRTRWSAWCLFVASGCVTDVEGVHESALGEKREAIIYGEDDRKDVFEHPDVMWRDRVNNSVVALIPPRLLQRPTNGLVTITADTLKGAYGLCDGERFAEQPAGADCSATLIDEDLVLTAGHCFEDGQRCDVYAYAFDYFYREEGKLETMTAADVYGCRDILVRRVSARSSVSQIDYAIVQLDRPALAPRKPATLSKGVLTRGEPVVALGFTSGVPAKIDTGAEIIDPRSGSLDYFKLNSDTFAGSSGSGLFDTKGELVGVLVRGGEDYVDDLERGCKVATRVATGEDGSPWEQGTYAQQAIDALCESGWPSQVLCGIAPRCGDGFCTMDEVAGSCPTDCIASCDDPPCSKTQLPELVVGEPAAPYVDAGIADGGETLPSDKAKGCSATQRPAQPGSLWLALPLAALLCGRRHRRR